MPKHRFMLFLLSAVIFVSCGCDKIPLLQGIFQKPQGLQKAPYGAVAKVGGLYITQEDLDSEVKNFNELVTAQQMPQNKIDTREKKTAYLKNDLVRKYILYQEALDRGIENRPEIARALRDAKVSLLVTELLREETAKIEVSSKEIENFYNQNKELLKEPEQRRIFEIVTPSEAEAKQVYIELLRGGDFSALARQYSKAASAAKGGDLGFIALEFEPEKRSKFEKFYEVAFSPSLETGGISNIFKGPDGYYIIKLVEIKKSQVQSLSELWDNIKSWLLFNAQQKAITDLADKVARETKVEVYDNKIE
ncbi:MAG: peptidyl-prolyl cis-trans isomerase [Candidatus Omnitrophica bacterium]|nr:peptidyl-prolyl cis-trans isomerase [Candidatus Omnitrophota bacterium]